MVKTAQPELLGQTALITGASRGIGAAIAEALAGAGCNVRLVCRTQIETLEALAQSLQDRCHILAQAYQADVGDAASVEALFASFPPPQIIINNAGISRIGTLTQTSAQDWDALLSTNLTGVCNVCRAAVPGLLARGGRILNISSVWGLVGASCEVAYSATKGGLNAFTRALAKELAPSGIPVNAIACGAIDTDMNRAHFSDAELDVLAEEIPAGRLGQPQEVAQLVLLLLQAPVYLTGQIISFDGGWT